VLAQHFLDQLNERYGTEKCLSAEALDALTRRAWPGNVRELLHTIRRQYITSGETRDLEIQDDPGRLPHRRASDTHHSPHNGAIGSNSVFRPAPLDGTIQFSVGTTFEEMEREALLKTLAHFHNNKREAARVLGISLKTVYNKLLRYRSQGLAGAGEDVMGASEGSGRAA
jgi:DNA-binding NtrC family response regulator